MSDTVTGTEAMTERELHEYIDDLEEEIRNLYKTLEGYTGLVVGKRAVWREGYGAAIEDFSKTVQRSNPYNRPIGSGDTDE
jgi:hypothetical protein